MTEVEAKEPIFQVRRQEGDRIAIERVKTPPRHRYWALLEFRRRWIPPLREPASLEQRPR